MDLVGHLLIALIVFYALMLCAEIVVMIVSGKRPGTPNLWLWKAVMQSTYAITGISLVGFGLYDVFLQNNGSPLDFIVLAIGAGMFFGCGSNAFKFAKQWKQGKGA